MNRASLGDNALSNKARSNLSLIMNRRRARPAGTQSQRRNDNVVQRHGREDGLLERLTSIRKSAYGAIP
jgi:hypothetical protein